MLKETQCMLSALGMKLFSGFVKTLPKRPRLRVISALVAFLFLNGAVLFGCTVAFFVTNDIPHAVFLIPYAVGMLYLYMWTQSEVLTPMHFEATLDGYLAHQRRMSQVFAEKQRRRHEFKYGSIAEK